MPMHQPFRQMSEDSRGLVQPKRGKERPDHQPRHQPNRPKPDLHQMPLIHQRLKRSGMAWTKEGGQVIVTLRVIWLSGVWEAIYQRSLVSKSLPIALSQYGQRRSTWTRGSVGL